MSRPRSEQRRAAILGAAVRAIATDGLGVPTATIARDAAVSNGSLFLYFATKSALLNELFVDLKTEMGAAAFAGMSAEGDPRELIARMWSQWLTWATADPAKRRALARLEVAEEITAESHRLAREAQRDMAALLDRVRADGPMRDAPAGFVLTLVAAMADTTMDAMIRDPAQAAAVRDHAFGAIWRVLAGTAH